MRVWIDVTNSPHVLVFRPLVRLLRERGAEVDVTARDFAQTLELLELHGIEPIVVGRHGGASVFGKARVEAGRLRALHRFARNRGYDIALAHGSHDLTLTARRLGIPSATTFDYEYAWLQHQLGCRAARRVVVPEAIPPERLERYGVGPDKLRRYPGLKEDYYLADLEPNPAVLGELGVDRSRVVAVLRPPPDVSLYHRHANPLFPETLAGARRPRRRPVVVLPRDRRPARPHPLAGPAVRDRARARGRRTEPDRVRRPRRLRRGNDEPGGRLARRAGLHRLRRSARRRGRAADPGGQAPGAHGSRGDRGPQARRGRLHPRASEIPPNCSTSWSQA